MLGSFILIVLGDPGVDELGPVGNNRLDQTLLSQLKESTPGERTTDLETLGDDGGCDKFIGGNLLVELVISGLIEKDKIVQLVPGLALGPLLLLGLTTAPFFLLGSLGRGLSRGLGVLLGPHTLLSCRSESSNN